MRNKDNYRGYSSGLDCYLANPKKYNGLSRWDLFKVDCGLHKKLSREGNLEKAIPEKKPSGRPFLLLEKVDKISELYSFYNGNAKKIAQHLNCSSPTILRYMGNLGLKARGRSSKIELSS